MDHLDLNSVLPVQSGQRDSCEFCHYLYEPQNFLCTEIFKCMILLNLYTIHALTLMNFKK